MHIFHISDEWKTEEQVMKEYSKWKSGKRFLTAAVTLSLLGSLGLYHDVRADFLEDMERSILMRYSLQMVLPGRKIKMTFM